MLDEVLAWLAPRPGGVYCDATVGHGGHAEHVLAQSAPDGRLVGLDRDEAALQAARDRLAPFGDRATLVHGAFSAARTILAACGALPCDGLLCDLGVSSPQLDAPERGFSFRAGGPLDMRMDRSRGETAAEALARLGPDELASVLRDYGEERYAGRIARVIHEAVARDEVHTTTELQALVAGAVPTRERHKDPATRTFQALRLLVNDELGELDQLLHDLPDLLKPGGRVVFIAFHSLEDRRVKLAFRGLAAKPDQRFRRLTFKAQRPSAAEVARNPRARSARLRAVERC
ncbi:MAG: 16S rRNA (cytosine(1402)-N(4))-methyltransferase RsmH [Deltaproteobacteria bacterium]|nr:16S rRNA (cytosine(1402)-N(4))-methyltransferase RsmH [Deltaproteobacteria bacterium]